jgi:hypothetical protein
MTQVPPQHVESFKSGACLPHLHLVVLPDEFRSPNLQGFQHEQFVDQPQRSARFIKPTVHDLTRSIPALKRVMENGGMDLDIIANPKKTEDGQEVIQVIFSRFPPALCRTNGSDFRLTRQLETAAGAAIRHFKNARGIKVSRSRFAPVKSCSDLLLVKSDLYKLQDGQLVINENRQFATTPVIELGNHFKKVSYDFHEPALGDGTHGCCSALDPTIPATVQEHSRDHRLGPLDREWRCLLWEEREAAGDCDRYVLVSPAQLWASYSSEIPQ